MFGERHKDGLLHVAIDDSRRGDRDKDDAEQRSDESPHEMMFLFDFLLDYG